MQLASSAPVFKSIALAGLVLGLGAAASTLSPEQRTVTYRLKLHAVDEPNAVYLSAFRNGDITMTFDGGMIYGFRIETRARVFDGCRWLGVETLTPRDAKSFDYDYSERIISCEPGATPTRKTPRQGIVTVEE